MIALVLGGATCVVDDFDAALNMGPFDGILGCNHVGIHWPGRFDAWCSLHADKLKRPWVEGRRRRGLPDHKALIGIGDTEHRFAGQTGPGSSGLFALKVALVDLGFDRAVLCGMPMSPAAAHFDDPASWAAAEQYHQGWRDALPHIAHRVRSMSGWTRDLLGAPDADFIGGHNALDLQP